MVWGLALCTAELDQCILSAGLRACMILEVQVPPYLSICERGGQQPISLSYTPTLSQHLVTLRTCMIIYLRPCSAFTPSSLPLLASGLRRWR